MPQQAHLGTSQYFANSIYPPRQLTDESYRTGLSQDAIDEVNRLMNRHPKYHMNPDGIIQWAIHSCSTEKYIE